MLVDSGRLFALEQRERDQLIRSISSLIPFPSLTDC